MNKTDQAKRVRLATLAHARRIGDKLTIALIDADLVDFDPQPASRSVCACCGASRDPMSGCYCAIGECSHCCSPGGLNLDS